MTENIDSPTSLENGTANSITSSLPTKPATITGGELLGIPILWLAKAVLFIACFGMLSQALADLPNKIFPNRSGLNDLDHMEILYYGLWIFLTWRYLAKVFRHQAAPHLAVYRYVLAYGIHAMLFTSIGVTIFLEMSPEPSLLEDWVDFLSIIEELTWLLLLFAIVPKGKLILPDTEDKLEQVSNEPPESAAR